MAVGDVMLGSTFPDATGKSLPPDDGVHLLDEVAPILKSADIAFGNLEGPLIDDGRIGQVAGRKRPRSAWAFRVPTRYGKYLLAAGFKVMGLANNHALDLRRGGAAKLGSTHVLESIGIAHSGPVGDIVAHLEVHGRKVAVIAVCDL